MNDQAKFYHISYTLPPSEERKYKSNHYAGVTAYTVLQAVVRLMELFPDATIHNVNHRGDINYNFIRATE